MIHYDTLASAKQAGAAPWDDQIGQAFHTVIFRDRYPVTPGHLLFVPRYNNNEGIKQAFSLALSEGQQMVLRNECEAFNIGINCGAAAGQTVMYPHVHLIPRRTGDCADPVGGVRGVIAGQANYKQPGYQKPA